MENATKALIIAAAILIAIVLISLGVFVLGNGSQLVKENSDMTGTQASTYNSQFEAYIGDKVSGTKVKQLVNLVNQHNRNAEDDSKRIDLSGSIITGTKQTSFTLVSTNFKVGDTYKITVDTSKGDSNTGYTKAGLIAGLKFE